MASFFTSYVTTAIWSSTDDAGVPLDKNHSPADISPETMAEMKLDCERFCKDNAADLIDLDSSQAGHDFWLTRNGHGAGFWDGDYPEPQASRLTASSKTFGTFDLYVGDDGLIHGGKG